MRIVINQRCVSKKTGIPPRLCLPNAEDLKLENIISHKMNCQRQRGNSQVLLDCNVKYLKRTKLNTTSPVSRGGSGFYYYF